MDLATALRVVQTYYVDGSRDPSVMWEKTCAIGSDGATWLDRELVVHGRVPVGATGFGQEVAEALERRAERLVEMGHAKRQPDGIFLVPRNLVAALERREVQP